MAKGFKNQLQKQKDQRQQAASMPEVAPASGLQEREVMLPTEQLNHSVLQDVSRAELEPNGQIIRVPIDDVYAVKQVRPEEDFEAATIDGMANSFDEVGILSPPRCYPRDKRGYRILFGETRWRSEKKRGEKYIDIYVGPPPKDDRDRIISQLSENIHQSGLKPLATANNMHELKTTWNMSQAEIAKVLGKPQTYVSKHMRLLDAPEVVKSLLKDKVTKDLDMVYTLSQISDINPHRAEKMVELLRDGKLTRMSAIKELNLLKGKPAVPPKSPEKDEQGSNERQGAGETTGVSVGISELARAATVTTDRDEQQPDSVKRDHHTGEEQIAPRQATALTAAPTVTPAVTTQRIMIMVDGEEGYLLTDKMPDEFGLVWIKLEIGEVCIEAKDVAVLGIKEV